MPEAGQTLSHYRLVGKIGEGGMGVVWKAEDTVLRRRVALKFLTEGFARDPDRLARFEREARFLASLTHANIAAIHGLEEADGERFLVLEFVPGTSLAERIKKGSLPVEDAMKVCCEIARALEAAHEKGVIHRDLKPGNVQITPKADIKVLDFGLAKAFGAATSASQVLQQATVSVTAEHTVMGTTPYMSPEQASAKPLDKRTDIWSFGCILYEVLTGQRAFAEETVSSTIAAIHSQEPDWQRLPGNTPIKVCDLLRRCLQKDPDQRLHDISDARIEIEEAQAELSAAETAMPEEGYRSSRITRRERLAWIMVALLLVAVVGLTYAVIGTRRETTTKIRLATASPSGVYYPLGVGIARLLERELPNVAVEVLVTEGSLENMKLLDRGEADLALVQNDVAFNSAKTDLILGHRNSEIVGLAILYEELAQIVVAKDAGIDTIRDLDDRVASLGPAGSGVRFSSEVMLSHFGIHIREPDSRLWETREAMKGLLDGSLAAAIIWRAIPSPFLEENFRTGKVELLSIDRQSLSGLRINQPFMVPATIPAYVYPNQDMPVSTITVKAMLAASSSVEADLVEDILRVIFTNIPDLIAHHPRASDISPGTAFRLEDGMPIDLHPGAERFFHSLSDGG